MSSLFPVVARDVVKSYRGRRVLDGVSITAPPGQRVGLVGENGVGKSTLLRLLAGVEEPEAGTITRPPDVGFLAQELPFAPGDTIRAVIDDALTDVRAALRRLDELAPLLAGDSADAIGPSAGAAGAGAAGAVGAAAMAEYGEVLTWAEEHDAWDADRRAELVLVGLGLGDVGLDRELGALSGGQRSRVGLASLLIRRPAALVLDEPTNHLDDDAVEFLQAHVRELPGVVVFASHDRVFLDAVCTVVADLDPAQDTTRPGAPAGSGGVTRHTGNYSDYLHAKRAERRRWEHEFERHREEIDELRVAVAVTARRVAPGRAMPDKDKMQHNYRGKRVEQSLSSRVRNAQRRLDEVLANPVPKPPEPLRFRAALTGATAAARAEPGPVLVARGITVAGRLTLDRLDIGVGERLLVTGANGAGKSTLLSVLAGRLTPDAGTVRRRRGLRVGLLEQDVVFAEPERSALAIYRATLGDERAEVTPLAELGLLAGPELTRPVGELSVGQRRRLALALLVARAPDVLLLDEPTNHLSLTLADELESAVRSAPGAIVVATHDRWQRRAWTGDELELAHGTVRRPVAA